MAGVGQAWAKRLSCCYADAGAQRSGTYGPNIRTTIIPSPGPRSPNQLCCSASLQDWPGGSGAPIPTHAEHGPLLPGPRSLPCTASPSRAPGTQGASNPQPLRTSVGSGQDGRGCSNPGDACYTSWHRASLQSNRRLASSSEPGQGEQRLSQHVTALGATRTSGALPRCSVLQGAALGVFPQLWETVSVLLGTRGNYGKVLED